MPQFIQTELQQLVIHDVGNQLAGEGLTISKQVIHALDTSVIALLKKYFLNPFKTDEYYHFANVSEMVQNELFTHCDKIFNDPASFYLHSVSIAQHLFQSCTQPEVKGGELYIAYFTGCQAIGEECEAVGIFKSETKESFLKINPTFDNYEIQEEQGLNINKLDRGCVVYNLEKEKGFLVQMITSGSKTADNTYWKKDFLNIMPRNDGFHHTEGYMKVVSSFIKEKLITDYEVEKTEEAEMKNRTMNYFKKNDSFDFNEFAGFAMGGNETIVNDFKQYKKEFQVQNETQIADEFPISQQAVKKNAKVYKSILKLDKNFHIYIHGNKELIEKGYDEEKTMKYYKVFFREEE